MSRTPSSAATASNSRPALEVRSVTGEPASDATASHRSACRRATARSAPSPPSHAAAIRQVPAPRPRRRAGDGARCPTRRLPAATRAAAPRPRRCRRAPSRCRRRRRRGPEGRRRPTRAPPGTKRRGRGGAARRPARGRPGRARTGRQVLGVQVVGDHLRLDVEQPAEVLDGVGERPQRGEVLRSPMCEDRNARRPARPRRCSSARRRRPAPGGRRRTRAAPAPGRTRGHGAPAAAGRGGRSTESSTRVWIARSWVSIPSASGASRTAASSSRWAMGSSETLPLVSTIGTPELGEEQVVQRRVGQHHPELAGCRVPPTARRRAARRGSRTTAAAARSAGPRRRRRRATSAAAAARSATITANGLSSRCLRRAQPGDRVSSSARTARW